jgi:hypothetical protein
LALRDDQTNGHAACAGALSAIHVYLIVTGALRIARRLPFALARQLKTAQIDANYILKTT